MLVATKTPNRAPPTAEHHHKNPPQQKLVLLACRGGTANRNKSTSACGIHARFPRGKGCGGQIVRGRVQSSPSTPQWGNTTAFFTLLSTGQVTIWWHRDGAVNPVELQIGATGSGSIGGRGARMQHHTMW